MCVDQRNWSIGVTWRSLKPPSTSVRASRAKVAGLQERRKLRKVGIADGPTGAIHHQHAALAALGRRLLGDEFFRQVVIEVGDEEIGHKRKWSVISGR